MIRGQLTLTVLGLLWVSACYTPTTVTRLSVESLAPLGDLDAQASPRSRGELTAQEAVRLGLTHHPSVRAARVGVDVAKAAIEGGVRRQNPELRLSQWHMEDVADGRWGTMDLSLRFRPERPGMNASRRAIGEQGVHQANAEVMNVTRTLTRQIRRLHARCVLFGERMKTAQREADLREEGVRLMSVRVNAGAATAIDLELARAAHAEVRDEVAEFRVQMAEAKEHLFSLVGADGESREIIGLPGGVAPEGPTHLPDLRELEDRALNHRPEIVDASAELARAHARAWQEGRRSWPWLRFAQVGYELDEDATPRSWIFSAGLEVPVFHWNSGRIAQAEAQVRHADALRRREGREILDQVRSLRTRVVQATERLHQIRDALLPAVQAAADAAEKARDAGALRTWGALSVATSRLEAQSRYLDAHWELAKAVIDLEAATGVPWPKSSIKTPAR